MHISQKNIKNPSAFKIFIKTERDQNGEIVPKLDLQYRRIIETILNARVDKKSRPNIAFLFTKTDTLPAKADNHM